MSRQRFIHPTFWSDPSLGKLRPIERLFFIGCFSNADDEGRLLGNPAYLRSTIFPYDDLTIEEVREIRAHVLNECRSLVLYEVDGVEYLGFKKWSDYQKPKYPKPSRLPPLPLDTQGEIRETFPQNRGNPSPKLENSFSIGMGLGWVWDGFGMGLGWDTHAPCGASVPDQIGRGKGVSKGNQASTFESYPQAENGEPAGQDPDGSVEAEPVTATSGEQRVKSSFTSRKQEAMFNRFWAAYPKRRNKGQAEKAWTKIKPNEQLLLLMLTAIEQAKNSEEWRKEDGRYIPYPATWLNAKGWEDEHQSRDPTEPKSWAVLRRLIDQEEGLP